MPVLIDRFAPRRWRCRTAALLLAASPALCFAAGIYTCKDKYGRTITSDRPIVECADTGQRVLAPDGSTRAVILTPEQERALAIEKRKREQEEERQYEQKRRERNLLQRYPNEKAWERAAMDQLLEPYGLIADAQRRIIDLRRDAQDLQEEAEFYKGRKLPYALKRKMDDNQISLDSEQRLIDAQRAEAKRIQKRLTDELIELRQLWAAQQHGG